MRCSACKLLELTVRSRMSPQYFSDMPSDMSACGGGGRDDGGPGGTGSAVPSCWQSELMLQQCDLLLAIASSLSVPAPPAAADAAPQQRCE